MSDSGAVIPLSIVDAVFRRKRSLVPSLILLLLLSLILILLIDYQCIPLHAILS